MNVREHFNKSKPSSQPSPMTIDEDEDEAAARLFAENVPKPAQPADPAAAAADEEFNCLKSHTKDKHFLSKNKYFKNFHPNIKCCLTNRDCDGNPKTAAEQSTLIWEVFGDRFTTVLCPDRRELFVCDAITKVWSKSPAAISSFMLETCHFDYYLPDGPGGRKVFPFQTQDMKDEVARCLLWYNTFPSSEWVKRADKVPAGFVACADGFWQAERPGQHVYARSYEAMDFITSDCVDPSFMMPIHVSDKHDDGSQWFHVGDKDLAGDLCSSFAKAMREVMPDPGMRVRIMDLLGAALLNKPHGKMLVLTGAGRDGKDDLMELLGALYPHLVTIVDANCVHMTLPPSTRIVCIRVERNGDPVDITAIKKLLRASILPVLLMNSYKDELLVGFNNLEEMEGRIAAFHMPSRFGESSPAVAATKNATSIHVCNRPNPPRNAPKSTNSYDDGIDPSVYNTNEGKFAVWVNLSYDGGECPQSVYDVTYKYEGADAPEAGVYGLHGDTALKEVYARAVSFVADPDPDSAVPFAHFLWAFAAGNIPIAVCGCSTQVVTDRLVAFGGDAEKKMVRGFKLKPKYADIVKERVAKEAARKRLDEKNEAARLRLIKEKKKRLAEEAAAAEEAAEKAAEDGEELLAARREMKQRRYELKKQLAREARAAYEGRELSDSHDDGGEPSSVTGSETEEDRLEAEAMQEGYGMAELSDGRDE